MAEVKDVTIRINVEDGDIKKTTGKFNELNSTVNKGSKEMTGSLNKMNSSLLGVGAALGGAFAIKAVVGDAIKRIKGFQQGIADLSAITGATGKDLEAFKKGVLDVSKNTGKSATEIAKAFQLVGSASPELLKNADSLAAVTEQAVILSKAGGIDVPSAANALTKAMNQFGASADDAAKFTDILATSQQLGTSTIDQTSEALKNAGANANAAGLSFEDTNVAIQALAKGGLVGSEAGTGLSSTLAKLASQSDSKINPSLNSLTDVVEELSTRNLGLKEATKLVGLESAKTLLTLVAQKDVVNDLTGELNQTGNAASQAATRFQTVDGQLEELDSSYERFILSLEDGDGVISKVTSNAIGVFGNLLDKLTELNDFDFSTLTGAESFAAADQAAFELLGTTADLIGAWTVGADSAGDFFRTMGDEATTSTKSLDETFSRLDNSMLANKEVALQIITAYQGLGLSLGEAKQKYLDLISPQKDTTVATEEDTEATDKNTTSKKKNLTSLEKQVALQKAFKKELEGTRGLQDTGLTAAEDGEEADADSELDAFTDAEFKKVEIKEEARRLDAENQQKLDDELFEQNLIAQDKEVADEEERKLLEEEDHQRKVQRNLEIGQAAADLAGVLSTLAKKGSAEAKALASVQVIINGAVAITQALAQLGPIAGALAAAGIIATTAVQLNKINSAKALKDGEVLIDGQGTETSDSIPAMLSKNESVINARSSKKHTAALIAINNDKFDEYLNRVIVQSLYAGTPKDKTKVVINQDKSVRFPKAMRISNAREISQDIVDAMNSGSIFNQGQGWD